MSEFLPVGKLPPDLLARALKRFPSRDSRVLVGPGPGLDCSVVDTGADPLLVLKSDPITFATDELGEYLVRINTNDIATTGAEPSWMLVTLLLPEGSVTPEQAESLMVQVHDACEAGGIDLVGGHTEVTHGLDRAIAVGAVVGEVSRDRLVTARGARPGDRILLTKGVPIEGAAILAHEFPERLRDHLTEAELEEARALLSSPGLDVLKEARVAVDSGRVTAMHDPTESGVAGALWELAEASGRSLSLDRSSVPVPPICRRVCRALGLDPLATIASGALLLTVEAAHADRVRGALTESGVTAAVIGEVGDGPAGVWEGSPEEGTLWPRPDRDEIARIFEA